jgi:hypothetical protein
MTGRNAAGNWSAGWVVCSGASAKAWALPRALHLRRSSSMNSIMSYGGNCSGWPCALISLSPARARRLSPVEIREKALASIAAMAIRDAAFASVASIPVMNLLNAFRRRLLALNRAFPLARSTLARHFPGSRSKAQTTNCMYFTTASPIRTRTS